MGKRGIRLQSTFQRLFTDEVEERSAAAKAAALIGAGDTAVDLIPAEELPPAGDSLAEIFAEEPVVESAQGGAEAVQPVEAEKISDELENYTSEPDSPAMVEGDEATMPRALTNFLKTRRATPSISKMRKRRMLKNRRRPTPRARVIEIGHSRTSWRVTLNGWNRTARLGSELIFPALNSKARI
jgi:hypothetical protein